MLLLAGGVLLVLIGLVAEFNLFGLGERWRNSANRLYDRNATPERRDQNTKRWVWTYRLCGLLGLFLILASL
jgi:hypothetical protein